MNYNNQSLSQKEAGEKWLKCYKRVKKVKYHPIESEKSAFLIGIDGKYKTQEIYKPFL
ncbi:hypothetical protein ACX0G9_13380 [Flavitalea flava]